MNKKDTTRFRELLVKERNSVIQKASKTLTEEAVKGFKSMEEELESLKLIVNKEKLAYLERERRKILNEINNIYNKIRQDKIKLKIKLKIQKKGMLIRHVY